MPIKLTELPEYEQARDKYTGALAAAKAAGDELAEMRAENEWSRAQLSLRDLVDDRNDRERAIETALTQAKEKFPNVPERLYSRISDPEEILAVAQEAHETITAASGAKPNGSTPPAEPRPTRSRAQSWPEPPAGGAPPGKQSKWNDEEHLRELNKRFSHRDHRDRVDAAEEVKEFFYTDPDSPLQKAFNEIAQRRQT